MTPGGHAAGRQYRHVPGHVHDLRHQRKSANDASVRTGIVALGHQDIDGFGERIARMLG